VKRALVIVLVCIAHGASAAPRSVMVLRSEGTADTSSRTTVDSHVLRLAKSLEGKVEAGDITLTEAAAIVGCNPNDTACKDQVVDTMSVDEIVATTVTATPTGLNVTVRRITKGGAPKAAQTTIPTGKSPDAKLNTDIGPLFGVVAPAVEPPPPPPVKPPPPPPITDPKPVATQPPVAPPAPPIAQPDMTPVSQHDPVTAVPAGPVTPAPEGQPPSRRWEKIGMGAGGVVIVLGVVMWAQASSIQSEIDDKPEPVSPADFQELRDLEQKGDDLAGGGNLFVIGGAVLTGVSAYFYWRAGRTARSSTARVTPVVFPGGGGIALGGSL
jgi:hypothetical protein